MAETTTIVCDACGMDHTRKGPVHFLNLTVAGPENDESLFHCEGDVHLNQRCILALIKTRLEQHFSLNGASSI